MQREAGTGRHQFRPFRFRFLHAIFTEDALSSFDHRRNRIGAELARTAREPVAEPVLFAALAAEDVAGQGEGPSLVELFLAFEHFGKGGPGDRSPLLDLALEVHQGPKDLFGTRRAARDVYVHRDEPIDALNDGVGVEDPPRAGAGPHADAPLRLGHLEPDPLKDGHHLHRHAPRDDHQVALPGAEPHHFRAEAGDVEPARPDGHELDPAAGGREGHRPEAVLPAPIHGRVERREDRILGDLGPAGRRQEDRGRRAGRRGRRRRCAYLHSNTPFFQA